MAAAHGTRTRYTQGCRCDNCKGAQSGYQRDYRECRASGLTRPTSVMAEPDGPGPAESGVQAEIAGLADIRPGLAQVALALARLMDNPRAMSSKPAAAKVLASLLDRLRSASTGGRGGHLAAVRTMAEKGGA
jgi:hypothetical protein